MRPAQKLLSIGLLCLLAPAATRADEDFCGPPNPDVITSLTIGKVTVISPPYLDGEWSISRLQWIPEGAHYSDIVRGSLAVLASSGGNFTLATETCLLEDRYDSTSPAYFDDAAVPAPGDGYWYLVRPDRFMGCGTGVGTYNSRAPRQLGDRDPEVQAASNTCGCFLGDCTVITY